MSGPIPVRLAARPLPNVQALDWAGLAACAAWLALVPTDHGAWIRHLAVGIACAAAVARIVVARDVGAALPFPGRFLLASTLAWGAWLMLSVLWSVQPHFTAGQIGREALQTSAVVVAFYAHARDDRSLRTLAAAGLAGLAAFALLAALMALSPGGWQPARWHHDVGVWSTYLVLVAPLLMLLVIPAPPGFGGGPRSLVVAAALAALLVVNLFMTHNRIGWIALAAAVATAALGSLLHFGARTRHGRMRYLLVTLAALLALAVAFVDASRERAERDHRGAPVLDTFAVDPRLEVWSASAELIAQRPIVGYGFGREILRDTFRARTNDPIIEHPHNVLLSVWLQTGIVGLALFAAMLAGLLTTYRSFLRERGSRAALAGILGMATVLAFVVKNLTDDFFYGSNAKTFFALNALLVGYGVRALRAKPANPHQSPARVR